ncbi:unnamed protein product, partial [Allacma fusca]
MVAAVAVPAMPIPTLAMIALTISANTKPKTRFFR